MQTKIKIHDLNLFYGEKQALFDINLEVWGGHVLALIGPSGCGKSSFMRCINRMNDSVEGIHIHGKVLIEGQDIYDKSVDVVSLRTRVGMVFQKPNPFPKSIYDNVAYGPRIHHLCSTRADMDHIVEKRSKIDWMILAQVSLADNNNGCVLPGPLRSIPRSF